MITDKRQLPQNNNLKDNSKNLRKAGNLSEVLLWQHIKNKQLQNCIFYRQKIIGNYIVDFYCPKLKLVIEIDGYSHDGKTEYDQARELYLLNLGLKIIHIPDSDVKNNLEDVLIFLENNILEIL